MAKIGIIIGSLRKGSFNRKVAETILPMFKGDLEADIIEIAELEMYNQDLDDESTPTQAWTDFREKIKLYDGIVFVTPEYNRSVPAVIKNAIDVGSRPYGANVWDGKPAAVITASTGAIGGFGSNHILRQSLVFVNMPTLQQPEAYLGHIDSSITEDGKIDQRTSDYLQGIVNSYIEFFKQLTK
ncbi:NADPH-dependent FMN reductase [Floricoccus penangensis]|uniref:NADPH-dependent FMN reductase n=1 Tax=Floricoccus penangensis TaxID=1859475 RepID=A0A9Q5P1X1_9LACT|nr:NAD(P)H-dependent oxidoreductase [Floricoccus penangensis]OFI47715.1 NADPH-dependent FMN reductase [Floricoccus penangensis]